MVELKISIPTEYLKKANDLCKKKNLKLNDFIIEAIGSEIDSEMLELTGEDIE